MQEIKFNSPSEEQNEQKSPRPSTKAGVVSPTRPNSPVKEEEGRIDFKEYNDEGNAITVRAYLKRGSGDFQKAFSKKVFYDFTLGVDVFSIDKKVQLRAFVLTDEAPIPVAVVENGETSVGIEKDKIKNGKITVSVEIKYSLGILKAKSYTLNLTMDI